MSCDPSTRRNFLKGVVFTCGITGLNEAIAKEQIDMEVSLESLDSVQRRYPEKTYFLGQVFNDTTNSYKLVWFLAILSLIKQSDAEKLELEDIFAEMAAIAWHPVCLYILSLGRQDKLQDFVLEIRDKSKLPANAGGAEIKKWINDSQEIRSKLNFFRRYVPTRFLVPWFSAKLRGVRDDIQRTNITIQLAERSQGAASASPYKFEGDNIILNKEWLSFFKDNMAVVESFSRHNFAIYLQARNPSVPGIINKLTAQDKRQLTAARQFWSHVREDFIQRNRSNRFVDIYSGVPIIADFSIDHFLPWTFVVHDLFWNLTPVEARTNSSKSNSLPDLDLYLPRLATLHYEAVVSTQNKPRLLEHYLDCFKIDVKELIALKEDGFLQRYREVMAPQTQIAINQGFKHGWKFQGN